ncbi:UNVERIFIED_CONTAM: Exportin-5 [Siphonaria sp. JEL0065]|nr:Exportin-5 [Siphonaria sp. JEL0065]
MELQLEAALIAIHNPLSDNATRAAAQLHLDTLKTTLPSFDVVKLGLKLFSESQNVQMRFFGLSLVEFVLRLGWDRLDELQIGAVREDLVSALMASFSLHHESLFLREKLCILVAQVAERMWPLQWPEFDRFLREAFHANVEAQECTLLVYKTLVEDTFCFENSIAELRKKDLSMSLIAVTLDSSVLNSVYRSDRESTATLSNPVDVDSVLHVIRADPHQEGWLRRLTQNLIILKRIPQQSAEGAKAKKLIFLTLDIVSTICQWIILDLVAEEKFWPVIITPLFETPYLGTIFTTIQGIYQCPDWSQIYSFSNSKVVSDDYEYLKRLAEAVAVFGERQLFHKQMTQKPSRFESYLELLYFFTSHPSRTISSIAASQWADLAGHEHFKGAAEVHQYTKRLISLCVARISEGDSEFISMASKAYDEVDFDDEGERRGCIDANRVRYLDILKYCAAWNPVDTFAGADAHLRGLLFSSHSNVARNVLEEFGFLMPKTLVAVQLEHASVLIEHTMKNIPNVLDPNLKDHRLLTSVSSLFIDAINLDAKDPSIIRCILSIVVCIAESVRDPNSLLKCIEKIVGAVTFTFPDETNFKQRNLVLREEVRQIRMKAGSSLVKLAVSLPDILIPLFDNFVQMIQSFIQQDQILQFERVKLIEFLLALIHYSSKDVVEKARLFASIVESYVVEWEAMDVSAFSSTDSILSALGVFNHISGQLLDTDVKAIESWRRKVNLDMSTWMMWMKRTKEQPSLWPEYLFRILPKLLTIVRCIHLLGDPSVWEQLPPHWRLNLSVTEAEKESILKRAGSHADLSTTSETKSFVDATASWIASIRETCYGLIGTMTGFGPKFYTIPNLGNIILANVFCGTDNLDNRHWKSLISSIVRPLVMNCPASAHVEVLDTIFPPFFQFIRTRLDREWVALETAKQGAEQFQKPSARGDDEEVSEEIIAEKILRELTRTCADLLVVVASPDEGKPGIKTQDVVVAEGSVYSHIMSNQVVFESVFGALLHVMTLKDTISSRKAVVSILKTLPILVKTQRSDVLAFLGETVLKTCLQVFHDGYFQEIHNEVISLVGDIYLALRNVNNTTAYQTFLSLPGMTPAALQSVDVKFMAAEKTKKERNVILRQFLRGIKGTSVSETFKQFDGKAKAKPMLERNTKRRDVLEANDENVAVLDGLF